MRRVLNSQWLWVIVFLVAFGVALLWFRGDGCADGFYLEDGIGCVRE